jgi:hypothetical protein
VLGLVTGIGVFAFVVVAVILGGGVAAVRRHLPQLGVLAGVVFAIPLLLPVLDEHSGGAFGVILIATSLLVILFRMNQLRSEPSEAKQRRRAAAQSLRTRLLLAALIVFVIFTAVLAAMLGRGSA